MRINFEMFYFYTVFISIAVYMLTKHHGIKGIIKDCFDFNE
ncbi:hypothetical protein [Companilactobacillus allii]|nr:hypothetical protein [Companilactobacillus allii]